MVFLDDKDKMELIGGDAEIISIYPRPFKTQYHKRERVLTNPGDPIKVTYSGRYDELGRVVLEESGQENLYDYIQSHADSVNINMLMKRFVNGETDVFSKVQGFYGDITDMPTNLAESLNHISRCEDAFESLPVEVRGRFGHNFAEFLASIGTPDFFEKLSISEADLKQDAPAEKEVTE